MKEKLFVLSMDAMVREDVEYMMTKPNFSKIMEKRAEVERVTTIYPSITYPAHTSILTGCRPGKHGIYNNHPLKTYKDRIGHWYLYSKSIQVEDLFAAAKRAGCSTAAVYWPITGCNPNIDYIIDEYFFYYPNEGAEEAFARLGAGEEALQAVRENMHRFPTTRGSKELQITSTFDDFIMGCTCSLIRNQQPDVLLVHNCYMDSHRHHYGVFGDKTKECLDMLDVWLGEVYQAMVDAGVYEDTNFVILSDHGQMDFTRRIKMNVLLQRGGLLDVAPDGTLYDWQAYAQSNGMSATIHLRDHNNLTLRQRVYEYLKQLAAEGVWGFKQVYTVDEVRERYGTYGAFSYMVETDGDTAFSDDWLEPVESPVVLTDYRLGYATHGYEPEKGPQPVFMGRGPAFKEGAMIAKASVVDEAPTLAKILGQEMPQAEGRCLGELLNNRYYC